MLTPVPPPPCYSTADGVQAATSTLAQAPTTTKHTNTAPIIALLHVMQNRSTLVLTQNPINIPSALSPPKATMTGGVQIAQTPHILSADHNAQPSMPQQVNPLIPI
ncbi:hypothetical protein LIER_12315 [Lithospermum erythrorhizon]|uniref:Uncharacterized protein n=1 Tax=Lithospermum erythrorhizon TaxID=34254 RepID=A0AAV3PTB3_LITER